MYKEIVFSDQLLGGFFCALLACLMLPVFYIIFYTFKKKIKMITVLMGILGCCVFGYIVSGLMLGAIAPSDGSLSGASYAVLRCVCVGISEGGGAVIAMWFLKNKYDNISTPISYALGYKIISIMIIDGAKSFVAFGVSLFVNQKGVEEYLSLGNPEKIEEHYKFLVDLSNTPTYTYFLSAVEIICSFVVMVAVCRIVWYAVHLEGRGRIILATVGIVFIALVDLPTAFSQNCDTVNKFVCEIVCVVVTLIGVGFAYLCSRRFDDKEKISAGPLNRKLL